MVKPGYRLPPQKWQALNTGQGIIRKQLHEDAEDEGPRHCPDLCKEDLICVKGLRNAGSASEIDLRYNKRQTSILLCVPSGGKGYALVRVESLWGSTPTTGTKVPTHGIPLHQRYGLRMQSMWRIIMACVARGEPNGVVNTTLIAHKRQRRHLSLAENGI